MSVLIRGAKNAVRNPVRTVSVIVLLGVATAFALSLLLANQAVKNKLEDLKTSGATTLTVTPAGSQGFQGGGEPLTDTDYEKLKGLENISATSAQLSLMARRQFFSQPSGGERSGPTTTMSVEAENKVGLESAVDAGTIGQRNFGGLTEEEDLPEIKIPVMATGLDGELDAAGNPYNLTEGEFLGDGEYEALVSTSLAEKNSLSIGSTFTAYDQTFTVVGIYDTGNEFTNNTILIPLKTAQTLSEQTGEISSMAVMANSIENIESVEAAINNALGDDKVDITSAQQNTADAIASLQSVERISIAGVVIAVIAAGTIVFLIMVMIVRERRREIAVLKAIGASNIKIVGQFVTEAVVLTTIAVVIGMGLSLASSNKITSLLVTTNTETSSPDETSNFPGPRGPGAAVRLGGPTEEQDTVETLVKDVRTSVGANFLAAGLGAVVLIGALGSAIPALAISKVRPAEVMRGDS